VNEQREAAPLAAAGPAMPVAGNGQRSVSLERLPELWAQVMRDMNAQNRRLHALLREADPILIDGDTLILAAAYEFHRDKLNTDDFRGVVEGVLARLLGTPVQVQCVLRTEVVVPTSIAPPTNGRSDSAGNGVPQPADPPIAPSAQTEAASSGQHPVAELDEPALADLDEQRLRAAKNIFDAEEIDPESIGNNGASPTAP
jgi:DNA polymerase-3 subunit gamma/tau